MVKSAVVDPREKKLSDNQITILCFKCHRIIVTKVNKVSNLMIARAAYVAST